MVLSLQQHAGNTAVGALLARQAAPAKAPAPAGTFSAEETEAVQERWKKEGGLTTTETAEDIETRDYILWRHKAEKVIDRLAGEAATGKGKTLEVQVGEAPMVLSPRPKLEGWIEDFEARERWVLRHPPGTKPAGRAAAAPEPADPGPAPTELTEAEVKKGQKLGAPPQPAFRIVREYAVTVPGREKPIDYKEAVRAGSLRPDYQYLQSEMGVSFPGKKLYKRADIDSLLDEAGIKDETQRKALKKVSAKEGGFEAVNTYDTGFVSAGAIQYISQKAATGSLIELLQAAKKLDPDGFNTYFRDLGIDVDSHGLAVVHPDSGKVLRGSDAVQAIIEDKRLTAVFQNAGENWRGYWLTQLKEAISRYWVADKAFSIKVAAPAMPGQKEPPVQISGNISDVLQSEAGKTALMDRAVQTGVGGAQTRFAKAAAAVAKKYGLQSVAELATWEREIIGDPPPSELQLVNRVDVLAQKDLTQPPPRPIGDFPTGVGAVEGGVGTA